MTGQQANDLYDRILQVATLPVLLLCIVGSIIIIQFLMSTKWQQARRNKQIRRAVEERKRLAAEKAEAEAEAAALKDR